MTALNLYQLMVEARAVFEFSAMSYTKVAN